MKIRINKDVAKRAFRTFFQSAAAYLIVSLSSVTIGDVFSDPQSALTGLLLSSLAAGLSALMNIYDNSK